MRLLADTHAALWLLDEDKRLSAHADELLTDATNEVLLSAAVVWEVAIKRSLGKLDAPDGFARQLLDGGAVPLPISIDHARAVRSLPWAPPRSIPPAARRPSRARGRDPGLQGRTVELLWRARRVVAPAALFGP